MGVPNASLRSRGFGCGFITPSVWEAPSEVKVISGLEECVLSPGPSEILQVTTS